jgi:hypothetical protein
MLIRTPLAVTAACLLAACASGPMSMKSFDQAGLPGPVQAPTGNRVAMETVGVGEITYECRIKAASTSEFEWFFVGPDARLMDRNGRQAGRYFGPPATWESTDGSRITATQVAVAPAMAGSIPYQLVKANPAVGNGVMNGVTYIQRVATRGGVAPAAPCNGSNMGTKQVVQYQADYIFYRGL